MALMNKLVTTKVNYILQFYGMGAILNFILNLQKNIYVLTKVSNQTKKLEVSKFL